MRLTAKHLKILRLYKPDLYYQYKNVKRIIDQSGRHYEQADPRDIKRYFGLRAKIKEVLGL